MPRAFTSFEEVLRAERLDGVVVATPVRVLPFHVIGALRRGLRVLAEKPLASSTAPLHLMGGLEPARRGRALSVAYPRRYAAGWIAAREWIASCRIGAIRRMSIRFCAPYAERYGRGAATHRNDPADCVAGVLMDCGSHAYDAIEFLLGRAFAVKAAHLALNASRMDVEAHVKFEGPICESIELALCESGEERKTVVIEGDLGTIEIEDLNARLTRQTCRVTGKPVTSLALWTICFACTTARSHWVRRWNPARA